MRLEPLCLLLILPLLACRPEAEKPRASQSSTPAKIENRRAWKLPAAPAGPKAELIRYGEVLLRHTSRQLGPDQRDPARRYAGNRLNCANCHLQAGQKADALGFVGISQRFPQYRPRENASQTLAQRIDGCFERSLNGKALPHQSREMQALLAYMDWLSQDYGKEDQVEGQGLPQIELLERAADPLRGKQVYSVKCAACHQADGLGLKDKGNYVYPPLWGPDSFNDGAGMHRLITAARFIKANMPLGSPDLSTEQAFDVAAYINSQPRPHKSGLAKDYPDRSKKPVDAPFPPWNDSFTAQQHKYGPFAPMQKNQAR